ncbi:MAG TPA: hypothetical protein VIM08_18055 [Arthrobacter sp.]|jgi:hypothetical protein
MFWLFTSIVGIGLVVVWNIFVHPIWSITTLLKVALGAVGIVYLLAGLLAGYGMNIFIGVAMLAAASAVSILQPRRSN